MNLREYIKTTLTPLNISGGHHVYTGTKTTYYTFFRYNKQGEVWAEDEEIVTGHYIQLDIWSKTDCTDEAEAAEVLMKAAGFSRIGGQSLYEKDTGIYHESLDFLYEEDVST
jgi:hypothetical protein